MSEAVTAGEPMLPVPYRIARRRRELADTFTLDLEAEQGGDVLAYRPGQFNMLYQFGVGEVPVSVSGDHTARGRLVHTIRAVGTVTRALARLKPGAVVGVRGPFGTAWPLDQARGADVLVVAGGLGLAPLRPAIYEVLAQRGHYGRFIVLYGARTTRDVLFRAELERWRGRLDTFVDVTVDRAGGDWKGNVGVVTRLIDRAGLDPQSTVALVCGPEIMMRFSVRTLSDLGIANDRIHVSMERSMKCAIGFCGRCQYGGHFICRDGPVMRFDRIEDLFGVREL